MANDPKQIAVRSWVANAKYPDLASFILGTIALPEDARHDEIETALFEFAKGFLPSGLEILNIMCGSLFFVPDEDGDQP